MASEIVFMTGATSGLGLEVASYLAAKGATVVATTRNQQKSDALLAYYAQHYPQGTGRIAFIECDLSSFESIVQACQAFKAQYGRLDTLINNAGVWNNAFQESKNKIEEIWHVNFLAPLLINHLLADVLAQSPNAKSIITASGLHQGHINFDDVELRQNYSSFKAYRQSKLAIILMGRWMAQKLSPQIGVYCQHPGLVSTELMRNSGFFVNLIFRLFGISIQEGAQTLLFLAEKDKSELVSGEYYTRKNVKKITPQSYDMATAERLHALAQAYLKPYLTTPSPIFGQV